MSEEDDSKLPDISLDPHTWLKPGAGREDASGHNPTGPDFDPRKWARPGADIPGPAEKQPGLHRRLLMGGALVGGLGVAAAGSMSWQLIRSRRIPPSSLGERRWIALDDAQGLTAAMSASHISGADVDAVAPKVVAALAKTTGELRIEMDLHPTTAGAERRLLGLRVERTDGSGVLVTPGADGWRMQMLASTTRVEVRAVRAEIDDQSFYTSAVGAGVADRLIPEIVKALSFEFDFVREIKPGDVFETVFESPVNQLGQIAGTERLLYLSMTTTAKASAFYRWRPPGKDAGWFDAEGRSVIRSLMRTPVDGARVTSNFGMRMHPVLGFMRAHKGVDFGASVGTPVYASGDGVIGFVGVHGGHGNYVRIDHSPTLSTAYAHLSQFDPASRVGASVKQGQVIALSGNTGLSNGPHLHYEVIVNGEQVDPLTFRVEGGEHLSGAALHGFLKERLRVDQLRRA